MPKTVTDEQIKRHLHTLTATPLRLLACTAGMDEERLRTPLASGEWSVADIMEHLRGCAEVWSYSIYAMRVLDRPQLAYIHPRDWTKKLGYADLSFAVNFQAFNIERLNLLRVLQGLSLVDWDRSATFSGKVNTFTIFSEVLRMASHEEDHCAQLEVLFPPAT